jgi:hypothetical protein
VVSTAVWPHKQDPQEDTNQDLASLISKSTGNVGGLYSSLASKICKIFRRKSINTLRQESPGQQVAVSSLYSSLASKICKIFRRKSIITLRQESPGQQVAVSGLYSSLTS